MMAMLPRHPEPVSQPGLPDSRPTFPPYPGGVECGHGPYSEGPSQSKPGTDDMRRKYESFVIALVLSSSAWNVAFSQNRRNPPNPVGFSPLSPPTRLLRSQTVRRELKFTEEQEQKASSVLQRAREVSQKLADSAQEKTFTAERRARLKEYRELRDAIDREAMELVTDEQLPRFKQIRLQISGESALFNAGIIEELKLDSVQTDALAAMHEKYQKKLEELPQFEGTIEERQRQQDQRISRLITDAREEYFGVLTEEQREQFGKMCGPKLEVDKSEFRE
jgi:Spy/CpxP family protein refolding chaperone